MTKSQVDGPKLTPGVGRPTLPRRIFKFLRRLPRGIIYTATRTAFHRIDLAALGLIAGTNISAGTGTSLDLGFPQTYGSPLWCTSGNLDRERHVPCCGTGVDHESAHRYDGHRRPALLSHWAASGSRMS